MELLKAVELLGLDAAEIDEGNRIEQIVQIEDVSLFRTIFGGDLLDKQRQDFSAKTPPDETMDPKMAGLMDFIFGEGRLNEELEAYAKDLFPIQVNVVAAKTYTISKDVEIGPNAAPYAIFTDELVINGGALTAKSTVLTVQAKSLLVIKGSPKHDYLIGVMGVAGQEGKPGSTGSAFKHAARDGHHASAPTPGICTGASNGGKGEPGDTGHVGGKGKTGNPGSPSLPATITISGWNTGSTSPFVFSTMSGGGGQGGPGGQGGKGQDGGHGGKGCDSGCEGTDGGHGGKAGKGGTGGLGGTGGSGMPGHAISLGFPEAVKNMLVVIKNAAPKGNGGSGGKPGKAGSPGKGGEGGKHKSDGGTGGGNTAGDWGKTGSPGASDGAPGSISYNWIS